MHERVPQKAAVTDARKVIEQPGRSLDATTRREMENRLLHDFSSVRVHHDGAAASSARGLRANAYTMGEHIVFGASRYAPASPEGRDLLAHELVHVVQQRTAQSIEPRVSNRADALESDADAASYGAHPIPAPASVPLVQRQEAVSVDIEVVTPQESERLRQQGVELPQAQAAGDPRDHSGFVDNCLEAVGFGFMIGGYVLYCQGFTQPVLYEESLIDFRDYPVAPINRSIYPNYRSAMRDVPMGPWQEGQPVPFAYFRGPNGVILPTLMTPRTAPRTAASMLATRNELIAQIQEELAVVALSILAGMAIRAVVNRIFRVRSTPGTQNLRPPNAVHDLEYTTSRHTANGARVQRDLARGREAHVFDDGVDLAALEQRVWTQGRRSPPPAGGGQRAEWDRYVWESPTPIGRRVQTGRPDVPLHTVEIKYNPATGQYHMVPRTRPAD